MDRTYSFTLLDSGLKFSPEQREFLMKWGLDRSLNMYKFTFDQPLQAYEMDIFVQCLFKDQNVAAQLGISGLVNIL